MYLKTWVKRFLAVFLSLSIMFLNIEFAQASVGRWIYSKAVATGGGIKLGVTEVASGTKAVLLTDVTNPRQVGNLIGAVAAGSAVGQASDLASEILFPWVGILKDLALSGVDYVMDPANNQVQWKDKGGNYCFNDKCFATAQEACSVFVVAQMQSESIRYATKVTGRLDKVQGMTCYATEFAFSGHPDYPFTFNLSSPESGTVPLSDVANGIAQSAANPADKNYDKAIADLQKAVDQLAKNGYFDKDLDQAISSGNSNYTTADGTKIDITKPDTTGTGSTTTGGTSTDTQTSTSTDGKATATATATANATVNVEKYDDSKLSCDTNAFNKKICDWMDCTQKKPDSDNDTNVTINEGELPQVDIGKVKFQAQCPQPISIDFDVQFVAYHEQMELTPLCDFFTRLKPFVVGMGYVSGAFIVAGVGRRG